MIAQKTTKFPSFEEMFKKFITEGTAPKTAARHAEELGLLSPPVKERFLHWWYTGELLDDLECKGYKISDFQKRFEYRIRCAFIDFNTLLEEDDDDGWMINAIENGICKIIFEDETLPD